MDKIFFDKNCLNQNYHQEKKLVWLFKKKSKLGYTSHVSTKIFQNFKLSPKVYFDSTFYLQTTAFKFKVTKIKYLVYLLA